MLTRWVQNDISSFLFARLLTRSVIRSGYLAVQISSSFSCVFVSFDHFSTGVLALFLLFSGIALCFLMLSFVRSSKKMYLVPPPPRNLSCSPHRRTHCLLPPPVLPACPAPISVMVHLPSCFSAHTECLLSRRIDLQTAHRDTGMVPCVSRGWMSGYLHTHTHARARSQTAMFNMDLEQTLSTAPLSETGPRKL